MLGNLIYYVTALFKGNLHFCDRCGNLAKCYPFGKQLDNHYKYVKTYIDNDFEIPKLPISVFKWGDARLCFVCEFEVEEKLGVHQNCCDKIIQWREDGSGNTETDVQA